MSIFLSLVIKPAVLTALICALSIGLTYARPYDGAPLRSLTERGEACGVPAAALCWQGIHIGQTTRSEALAILRAHPWIGDIFETALTISWRWNGQQPALIDGERDGLVRIEGGIVRQIRMQTRATFGDLWLAYGPPDSALLVRPFSLSSTYQIVQYSELGFHLVFTAGCPTLPARLWRATTTFGMGDMWLTETLHGEPFDIYERPSWWRRLGRCRP